MKFVEVAPSIIKMIEPRYTRGKVQRAVIRFMESNMQAAELVFSDGEYVNLKSAYGSYQHAIKRIKAECTVVMRNGKVYMYKNTMEVNNNG